MKGSSAGKDRGGVTRASSRKTLGSRTRKGLRSALALVLALAFVPIVPMAAYAVPVTGPLTLDTNYIYANGAPITISEDAVEGIDVAWPAGTFGGVAYEAGSYNYAGDNACIFGGSLDADVATTSVTMVSGHVEALHGGGRGTAATTPGDVDTASVIMEGGTVYTVMGGGENYSSVLDTTVFISGGTVTGDVFAGGLDDSGSGSIDQLKSYYTMRAGGGADDPLLYTNNYTGMSHVTIQGDAIVDSVDGSGAEDTITDSSTIDLLGGHTAWSYASYYNSLCYDSTIHISGDTTEVTGAALLCGKAYAGNVDMTVTGGKVGTLELGTMTDALHEGMGEVLGDTSVAVKDDLISTDKAFITGTFDGNLSLTGNTTYTLHPSDDSNMTVVPDGAKWEADTATIIVPNGLTLYVDGTLIAGNIDNHGKIVVEDGSVTVGNTLTNESDGRIQVRGAASLDTLDIRNSGLITRGELAAVSCTDVDLHTVLCSSDVGGSMSPQGYVVVADGDTLACTITPDTNNTIKAILLDGAAVASPSANYSLTDVRADHTLESTFQIGYDIALDPSDIDFGNVLVGYTAPASRTVKITNTGQNALSVTGVHSDSANFVIGQPAVTALEPGGSTTFTVQPVSGLALGDYQANISITGDNIATRTVTAAFSVIQPVAMIGTTPYASLQEAFDAATDGDTVKIVSDIALDEPLRITTAGTVTLTSAARPDGSYYTISPSDEFDATKLSMIDLSTNSSPTTLSLINVNLLGNPDDSARALYVGGQNTLNVNAGTTISGFSLTDSGDGTANLDGAAIYSAGANINVNGGEIFANMTVGNAAAIYLGDDPADLTTGALTLRGGNIHDNAASMAGGAIVIGPLRSMVWTGGIVTANKGAGAENDVALVADDESAARLALKTPIASKLTSTITGAVSGSNNTKMTVSGRGTYGDLGAGTYNWDPGTLLWYDNSCVARITTSTGTIFYTDLAEALADATDGQTIVLINDTTLDQSITLANATNGEKKVTLMGTRGASNRIILGADVGDSLFVIPKDIRYTLTVDDVDLEGNALYDVRCFDVGANDALVIDEGTQITGFTLGMPTGSDLRVGSAIYARDNATVTINGGAISANKTATSGSVFMEGHGGILNVNGGKITGNSGGLQTGGVAVGPDCTMNWSGGTISGNTYNGNASDIFVKGYASGFGTLNLSGDITPDIARIFGSTTGDNAARMVLANGAVEVWSEGLSTWVPESATCRIGDALYDTLQDAFDAAKEGDTITIIENVALPDCVEISTAGTFTLTADVSSTDAEGNKTYFTLSPVADGTFTDASLISSAPGGVTNLKVTNINLDGKTAGCRALYEGTGDTLMITSGADIEHFSSSVTKGAGSTVLDPSGSAVYLAGAATMVMDGGTITANMSQGSGAICLADTSGLTLSGGTIDVNRADGLTAGVYVGNTATFTWDGAGTIGGNYITDDVANDVFVDADLASSGLLRLADAIQVPDTTVITGTTDTEESYYSVMLIGAGSAYGTIMPTRLNGYLWAEVGGTYTWVPAVAIDRKTGENLVHGYFSISDAINLSGTQDAIYIFPAALNTQLTRTISVDIVVDHDLSLINETGGSLTILQNRADSTFTIENDCELTLDDTVLDIVDGRIDNNGTIKELEGGKLLPTLALKTQVTPSLATSEGGSATMSFEAEKTGGSTTNPITYQWYECSSAAGDNPVAVDGATGSTFENDYAVGTSGTHYYDCVADLNGVTLGSAVCTVTVAPADVSLKISDPNPSTFADVTYGYTTGSTVTYTITNTGVTTLTNIQNDSHLAVGDEFTYVFALGFNGTLAPGEKTTVTITSNGGMHAGHHLGTFTAACDEYTPGVSITLDQYVMPKALNVYMVEEVADQTYTGHPIVPEVHLSFDDQELVEGTDYTYTCTDNVDSGWATINVAAVTGSDFTGVTTGDFKIRKASLDDAVVTPIADQTYTGSEIRPELSLTFNGVPVPSDAFRTYYLNNTDVGIADIYYYVVIAKNFETLTGGDANFKIVRSGTTGATWTRLAGANRYQTMAKIVDTGFTGTCSTVILTTGTGYADALSASELAGLLSCPILTTDPETLSPEAASEIARLQASKVIILGGTGSVSAEAEAAVRQISGVSDVTRIAGVNRIDTGYKIYQYWVSVSGYSDTCFITKGYAYADALSIAPYAYADSSPIFLANSDGSLSPDVTAAVKKFSNVIVLGGSDGITDATMNSLGVKKWMRLAGLSGGRYGTSLVIARWASGLMDNATIQPHGMARLSLDDMVTATGANYPDALTSVDLAGMKKSVLLLVADDETTEANILGFIEPNKKLITQGYVLGSEASVDANVMNWLETATA